MRSWIIDWAAYFFLTSVFLTGVFVVVAAANGISVMPQLIIIVPSTALGAFVMATLAPTQEMRGIFPPEETNEEKKS